MGVHTTQTPARVSMRALLCLQYVPNSGTFIGRIYPYAAFFYAAFCGYADKIRRGSGFFWGDFSFSEIIFMLILWHVRKPVWFVIFAHLGFLPEMRYPQIDPLHCGSCRAQQSYNEHTGELNGLGSHVLIHKKVFHCTIGQVPGQ